MEKLKDATEKDTDLLTIMKEKREGTMSKEPSKELAKKSRKRSGRGTES